MPQNPLRKREYNRERNRRLRSGFRHRNRGQHFEGVGDVGGVGGEGGEGNKGGVVPVVPIGEFRELWTVVQSLQAQVMLLQQRATLTEAQMALLDAMVRKAEEWSS